MTQTSRRNHRAYSRRALPSASAPPPPRALYLENRLDCRVWAYYCELRDALARRLTLVSRDDALRDGADLVIVGPRYATNILTADEPLGVSRALLRHVPLVLVQNKMYAPSARGYVGSRSAKMAWARQLGVAVAFSCCDEPEDTAAAEAARALVACRTTPPIFELASLPPT